MKKNNKLYKGTLLNIVLKLLSKDGKMYGYQMSQIAKLLTEGELEMTEGSLYPILHKLEADGIIESEIVITNGRERKYYFLTEKGKGIQVEKEQEVLSFIQNLTSIFN